MTEEQTQVLRKGGIYRRIQAKSYSTDVTLVSYNDKKVLYKPNYPYSQHQETSVQLFLQTYTLIPTHVINPVEYKHLNGFEKGDLIKDKQTDIIYIIRKITKDKVNIKENKLRKRSFDIKPVELQKYYIKVNK